VKQLGAGSGAGGVEALPKSALQLVGVSWPQATPSFIVRVLARFGGTGGRKSSPGLERRYTFETAKTRHEMAL
jgi:hypothetical protein